VPVIDDGHVNWNPVWSPDGRYLYYVSDLIGSPNLWRVRIDEGSGRALAAPEPLTTPAQWSGQISLAAAGGRLRIAYATRDGGRSNLERIPFDPGAGAAAGPPAPVTEGARRIVRSADVSPDGRQIVYDTASPQEDLFVARVDGTAVRQITNDPAKDRVPRWSPRGDRILFYSDRDGGSYQAWTIRPDGSGLTRLTDAPVTVFSPLWSPDGGRIVYGLYGEGQVPQVLDLSPPRRAPQPLPPVASGGGFSATSWSPDGRRLAGSITRGQRVDLALFDFSTRSYEVLARDTGEPYAAWLDAGRLLYVQDGRIRLFDLGARRSREVLAPPPHFSYGVLSVARDGRVLYAVRAADEGDIWMAQLQ